MILFEFVVGGWTRWWPQFSPGGLKYSNQIKLYMYAIKW